MPSRSEPRGGRVVTDTEKTASGWRARSRWASVVLPAPEGADRMRSSPGARSSFDILHLLAQPLDLRLRRHHDRGDLGALRLRADGVHLAVHLLDEEVELAPGRLGALEQRPRLGEVAPQAGDLLGDVR